MTNKFSIYVPIEPVYVRNDYELSKRITVILSRYYGGCTEAAVTGNWLSFRLADTTIREPVTVIYTVTDKPYTHKNFKRLARAVKSLLDQECVLVTVEPIVAEFI